MRFEIIGLKDSFGKHRFSNNVILQALADSSIADDRLIFVWWLEKVFLNQGYEDVVERLITTEWFGVLHIPLLTPNWAMYSQNNVGKLYFLDNWRRALKKCRGLICLSKHLAHQVSVLYPGVRVFSLKHPIGSGNAFHNHKAFVSDPKVVLVGAWLRDFDSFFNLDIPFRKIVLLSHYAESFLKERYAKYSPGIIEIVRQYECISFLDDAEYDNLLSESLVFLAVHDTSANNAVCECLAHAIPFISNRHPAIEEYVGSQYPLFLDSFPTAEMNSADVFRGHGYLAEQKTLCGELSLQLFIRKIDSIYRRIALDG